MTNRAYLDMDGVLANFIDGVCNAHGRPSPYLDPANHGKSEIDHIWGMTATEFWAPVNNSPEFWDGLQRMPDADDIVASVIRAFGEENIAILTAPSMDPQCVPGKRRWMRKYYPMFSQRMIFGSAKDFLAGPHRFLIDDRDKNLEDFERHGGHSICVPRLWNNAHANADRAAIHVMTSCQTIANGL